MEKPLCISYIRFSTTAQLDGSSLERQLKLSQEYAQEHGLTLDDKLSCQDLGRSAFSGDHVKKGHFGTFIDLVKQGAIPAGSVLLVESLERLLQKYLDDIKATSDRKMKNLLRNQRDDEIEELRKSQKLSTKDDRYFKVIFKNGNYRIIKYSKELGGYRVSMEREGDQVNWTMGDKKMKPIIDIGKDEANKSES